MRIKLDENLGKSIAGILREAGHDVHTVRDEGLTGSDDRRVIAACRDESRCLVTLDLDFANPLVFTPRSYGGIAVFRLPANPSHADLIAACQTLAQGLARDSIEGRLWIIQRGVIREYRPADS